MLLQNDKLMLILLENDKLMRRQIELHVAGSIAGCSRRYGTSAAIQVIQQVAVPVQRRVNYHAIVPSTCRNVVRHQDFLRI